MKFPVITPKTPPYYPSDNRCPICGADRTQLDSTFIVLNGGALKEVDSDMAVPCEGLSGFLSLTYHSHQDHCASVDIVEYSLDGQFELCFCSFECLQMFFAKIVSELKTRKDIEHFKPVITAIVHHISMDDYDTLAANGQNGRIGIDDLKRIVAEYGRTIIPLPDEAFAEAEVYTVGDRLDIYIPLWTKEEGRSDLTLSLSCCMADGASRVEIDDLHVL